MHVCAPREPGRDLLKALGEYRAAGISMVAVNIADAGYTLEQATRTLASYRAQIALHSDKLLLVHGVRDIAEAEQSGRLGVCFDVEGAFSLGTQVDVARLYYDLGVRWMAFAYNRKNAFGFGCHDEVDEGLTALGRELVRAMDEIGMIKCCSHTGYRTGREVFELSKRPCILSHSNPRELVDHPRNVPDEVMTALAQTGGVMGINGVGIFLGKKSPTVDDLFAHVDYAVNLIGAEHVGIGLDFITEATHELAGIVADRNYWPEGYGYHPPINILGPAVLPSLAERMKNAGYPDAAIGGILGENFRRVATEVWPA
jgi:membrane dipeptidase